MPRTALVAHRGGSLLAPENTLAAFRSGIEQQADYVECDVHLSKDGEVVVMHDPDVSRTTDGAGQIGDLTLAELKKLNAAAKFKGTTFPPQDIPTLQQVLETAKGKAGVQIEIKTKANGQRYAGIEQKVVDLLRKNDMVDKVVIISFDFPTLTDIKKLEPRLKTGALASAKYFSATTQPAAAAQEVKNLGADYFGVEKSYLTAELMAALRQQGVGGGAWTVNDPTEMKKLIALQPDFLTSDRPDLLRVELGR